jgi:hypothetical protein
VRATRETAAPMTEVGLAASETATAAAGTTNSGHDELGRLLGQAAGHRARDAGDTASDATVDGSGTADRGSGREGSHDDVDGGVHLSSKWVMNRSAACSKARKHRS